MSLQTWVPRVEAPERGAPWGAREPGVCATGTPRVEQLGRGCSGEVQRPSHLLSQRAGVARALQVRGVQHPPPLGPSGVGERGPLAPRTRPAWPPASPARVGVSSSPAGAPPVATPSLLPFLPPSRAPTRPCQAPCPGGCQAPGGTKKGHAKGELTSAGPQCPELAAGLRTGGRGALPVQPPAPGGGGCGRPQGAAQGACRPAKKRQHNTPGAWAVYPGRVSFALPSHLQTLLALGSQSLP